jgi:hypothetical protein
MSARIDRPSTRPQTTPPQDRRVVDRPPSGSAEPNRIQDALQRDQLDRSRGTGSGGPHGSTSLEMSPGWRNTYAQASASDRQLLDSIKNAPNSLNAFATYQNLRGGQQNPERLTDSMVRDLVTGVANARSPDHNSPEGLLSQVHAANARSAICNMPQAQYEQFKRTYDSAGGPAEQAQEGADPSVERQLMLKALGARSTALTGGDAATASRAMNEVQQFGRDIRGVNAEDLKLQTTVLETENTRGYTQGQGLGTCAGATNMAMRAENDPIYARTLHMNAGAGNAQSEIDLVTGYGGHAIRGLSPDKITELHNNSGVDSKLRYSLREYAGQGDVGRDLNRIADCVAKGQDVPMGVNFAGGKGHAMHVTAVEGEPGNRTFYIHDTNSHSGRTRGVPEKDLLDGSFMTKHFGYPPEYANAWVATAHLPSSASVRDPAMQQLSQDLGIVTQEQVDRGLINAAREKNGQPVVKEDRPRAAEPEPPRPARNKDLDDGISIDDDFGIDD